MVVTLDKYFQGTGEKFIKAKDIKGQKLKAVIIAVREAELPQTGLSLILDIEIKKKAWSFPLNKTNCTFLMDKHGDDEKKWIGKVIDLVKVLVNNPKLGKEVESIRIR